MLYSSQIIGGAHGNEAVTTEMTLQLMQLLLSHGELDDAINRIMKGYSIHILPTLNRDGAGLTNAGDCLNQAGSLNQAGIDLVENFGTSGNVQPEAKRVMNWMKDRKFLFSLNLLGTDENIVVPNFSASPNGSSPGPKYAHLYSKAEKFGGSSSEALSSRVTE